MTIRDYYIVALGVALSVGVPRNIEAGIIGVDVPGTGVVVGPCTVTSFDNSTLDCATGAVTNFNAGYSTPSQASFNGSWTGSNASENLTASGASQVGQLEDSVQETVTSGQFPVTGIFGEAASFVEDTLTISDPALNGTAGSLVLGLAVDGTGSTPALTSSGIYTSAALAVYAGTPVEVVPPFTAFDFTTPGVNTSYSGPAVLFTFGDPFSIELWFEAAAFASCGSQAACSPWTGLPVSVTANASDTAILDSLTVYDSNSNIVPGSDWSAISGSGAEYTADGVVPEPSSWALLMVGLGVFGAYALWRFRTARMLNSMTALHYE